MPLPEYDDKVGNRALEPKCASPTSSASKNTVAQLSELPPELKAGFLVNTVIWGLPNLVRCALQAKISANSRGTYMNRPVLVAAAFDGSVRILKLLLDAGADHGLAGSDGGTALSVAATCGHLECIQLLLAAGADAKQAGAFAITPLMSAVMLRHTECVRALIPASNLLATSCEGRSAIHLCALLANEECFELLLPLMSDVDVRTIPGVDEKGNAVEPYSSTPLLLACGTGQQQMARALLKRGANRMARDSKQRTCLMWASMYGHLSCCVLLIGQPGRRKMTSADVNATDLNGCTSLHNAAHGGYEKVCGFLLEAGARLDVQDSYGCTPLMVAQQEHPTNAALHALLSGQGPAQPPGTVCDHCGKTAAQASVNNLKACSECHAVRYCGAACSAAAWLGHKKACRARAKERAEEKTKTRFVFAPPHTSASE